MAETQQPEAAADTGGPAPEAAAGIGVNVPDFAPMQDSRNLRENGPMDRFFDVHVTVSAELGRISMPLGEIMKLDEGSVLRLDRPVSEPVKLVSQGVTLARGEVVVIDDCFAIRIKEIESTGK